MYSSLLGTETPKIKRPHIFHASSRFCQFIHTLSHAGLRLIIPPLHIFEPGLETDRLSKSLSSFHLEVRGHQTLMQWPAGTLTSPCTPK